MGSCRKDCCSSSNRAVETGRTSLRQSVASTNMADAEEADARAGKASEAVLASDSYCPVK